MTLQTHAEIDTLLGIIESTGLQNLQQTLEQAAHILALSEQNDYAAGISMSCYYIAQAYGRLYDFVSAATYAKRALDTAQEHGLVKESAYALIMMAGVYANVGMTYEALELLQQNEVGSIAPQYPAMLERYVSVLAVSHLNTGETDRAIHHFQQVLELGRKRQRLETEFAALYNIGAAYSIVNDRENALDYFQQALISAERDQALGRQVLVLTAIAGIELKLDRVDDAQVSLERAVQIASPDGTNMPSGILRVRGHLRQKQGDLTGATELIQAALEIAKSQNDWYMIRFLLNELSEIHESTENYQKALACIREMHEVTVQSNSSQAQMRIQTLQILHEMDTLKVRSESAEREFQAYKLAEAERLEKERLLMANQQAQELTKAKERILTRLHHEIRTPISIIYTSAHLIGRYGSKLPPERVQAYINNIEQQNIHIGRILENVSNILHATDASQFAAVGVVDVSAVYQHALAEAYTLTQTADRVDAETEALPDDLVINETLLSEIIVQLLTNALKFSTARVQIRIGYDMGRLELVVTDHGIGIPPEELHQIGEPLFRASNTDDVSGNGLGLAIVRQYIQNAAGSLHIDSTLNAGCRVTVLLPVEQAHQENGY